MVLLSNTCLLCSQVLSAAKLKEGIFVGPQIREVLKDTDFEEFKGTESMGSIQVSL